MKIVAPPNVQIILINSSWYMEYGFITDDNFGCKMFIIFKAWQKVTVKCAANLFALGSYMLHYLVRITFKFLLFLQNCMHFCV
jgi:hypothetical protein